MADAARPTVSRSSGGTRTREGRPAAIPLQLGSVPRGAITISTSKLDAIKLLASALGDTAIASSPTGIASSNELKKLEYRRRDAEKLKHKVEASAFDMEVVHSLVARKALAPPFDVSKKLSRLEERAEMLVVLKQQVCRAEMVRKIEAREDVAAHHILLDQLAAAREETERARTAAAARRQEVAVALEEQRAARTLQKEIEAELRAQEGEQLARSAAAQTKAAAAAAHLRHESALSVAREVATANAMFASRGVLRLRQDAEDDAAIVAFQREKARQETVAIEARAAESHERDVVLARIVAAQKKVTDNRGAEAEVKAHRESERAIMQDRAEREAIAAAKSARTAEYKLSLAAQIRSKQQRLYEEELREEDLVTSQRAESHAATMVAAQRHAEAKAAREHAPATIQLELRVKAAAKAAGAATPYEERWRMMHTIEADRLVVEGMRATTIARLTASGAPASIIAQAHTMALS